MDIDSGQNFVLTLNGQSGFERNETINCLSYNQKKGMKYTLSSFFLLSQMFD